jgi:quercetin dioxygenase-like cupin family protein
MISPCVARELRGPARQIAAGVVRWLAAVALACSHSSAPVTRPPATPASPDIAGPVAAPLATAEPPPASEDERLAAIQKAMNELDEAAQQCWAAAATERFDIEGELSAQIDIAAAGARASLVRDTVHNAKLSACISQLLTGYRWAPPLHGQTIQLPFKFRAPDGQSTIDRQLVPWNGQSKVSVAVLLDDNNTGNAAASMFEIAIAAGGTTGLRRAARAELWYFLEPGALRSGTPASRSASTPASTLQAVAAGDMVYVPKDSAREIVASAGDLHAMIVMVPGGREGAARGGALPTPEVSDRSAPGTVAAPIVLRAAGARSFGPVTLYAEPSVIHDTALAASVLTLPAGGRVAEHVHARETELLYILAGAGSVTVAGVELPLTPTSVVQIPSNTKHAFTATSDIRAVQIYTPAGPEQRFKTRP